MRSYHQSTKKHYGAREMAYWITSRIALRGNPGLILNTHVAANNWLAPVLGHSLCSFGLCRHIYIYGNTQFLVWGSLNIVIEITWSLIFKCGSQTAESSEPSQDVLDLNTILTNLLKSYECVSMNKPYDLGLFRIYALCAHRKVELVHLKKH